MADENIEPDVIFGTDPDDPSKGSEPEPSFPGSTPEGPRFGINKEELLLAVDLCTLAYETLKSFR